MWVYQSFFMLLCLCGFRLFLRDKDSNPAFFLQILKGKEKTKNIKLTSLEQLTFFLGH
jgi:hypothetical protein